MLRIKVYSALDLMINGPAVLQSPFCILKYKGAEIGRTDGCEDTPEEPFWNQEICCPIKQFEQNMIDEQRPFLFEHIDVELYLKSDHPIGECLGATKLRLINFENPEWSRIISKSTGKFCGRVLIGVTVTDYDDLKSMRHLPLSTLLPPCLPQFSTLYIGFQTDTSALLGFTSLPGPNVGELVLDRYNNVEWKVAVGSNAFGDKYYVNCKGSMYLTDLRVLFIPEEISAPSWCGLPCIHAGQREYCAADLLLIRRTTHQMPLCGLQDCRIKIVATDVVSNACGLIFESRDNTTTEFIIRREVVDMAKDEDSSGIGLGMGNSHVPVDASRKLSDPAELQHPSIEHRGVSGKWGGQRTSYAHSAAVMTSVLRNNSKIANILSYGQLVGSVYENDSLYNNGLDTATLEPSLWCTRIQDMITWLIEEDYTWLRWCKYLKKTCESSANFIDKAVLRKLRDPINIDDDYQRLHVLGAQWNMSDVNFNFEVCTTYPQTLVLPDCLTGEDIVAGATQRSKGRLPVLVWLHPQSNVPLCRCAQPQVTLSAMPEYDRKVLVSIKNACPSGLPLRIADARPRLNAQANAMQGKGYENISFLGGPNIASLQFLDIDNIHVMRNSISKLRENSTAASTNNTANDGSSASSMHTGQDNITSSKWLYHVSNVLRGSIGVAESLQIGHPVVVHCSDGWDRTAQLCALAQLLLDPYYRTIDGLLLLIKKEWCTFGHKFEDRLGSTSSKESSPVFLQFLDCIYQLCLQFPTDFAYSTHFLAVLCHATYSGYFTTYKENNEMERYRFLRNVFMLERLNPDDLEFSSIFCYMKVLLHSNVSAALTNPHYSPPDSTNADIKYLRPRYLVSDLQLWREGLFGMNHPNFKGYMPNGLTANECIAISSTAASKFYGYFKLHAKEVSVGTATRMTDYLNRGNFVVPLQPYSMVTVDKSFGPITGRNSSIPVARMNRREYAALSIQLWYRSVATVYQSITNRNIACPNKLTKNLLRAVVWGELKLLYMNKLSRLSEVADDMLLVINKVLEDALQFCFKKEAAVARVIEYEQTSLNNSLITCDPDLSLGRMAEVSFDEDGEDDSLPHKRAVSLEKKSMFASIFRSKSAK